jgi:uncharacterized DUF497 family protein
MYNVQYYIQKLEEMTEYNFPFERVKQVKQQLTGLSDGEKPKEEEEPRIQEITEDNNNIVITASNEKNKDVVE